MDDDYRYRSRNSEDEEVDAEERGGRFVPRARVCQFCVEKIYSVDYKQTDLLRKYINEAGKIRPRRQTGACAKHQRMVTEAVKRARHTALMPYNTAIQ